MPEILRWILGLIVTVVAILFAVANRDSVPVTWSPFESAINLPVYAVALSGALLGFLIGGAFVWLDAGTVRRERRQQKKKISRLERTLGEDTVDDAP